MSEGRRAKGESGAALVLVIAILAALLAIAGPFALSMRLEERTARGYSAGLRAELAARAAREIAVRRLLDAHPDFERRRAVLEKALADSPEDWTETSELAVALADLPGASAFEVRDPRGLILAAEVEDEQGKVDLNSAPPELLGNLLGVTVLAAPIDEKTRDIEVEDASPFYCDQDPETFDGLLLVGGELIAYRDIRGNTLARCERGVFFSAPEPEALVHPKGELVRDARGLKLASTPFWLEFGEYRPFERVSAIRDIAGWQLSDAFIAGLFARGYTAKDLEDFGLGGEELSRFSLRARAPKTATATAQASAERSALEKRLAKAAEKADEKETASAVGAVLARLGRREGERFLRSVFSEMRGRNEEAARRFVEQAEARLRRLDDYERRYFRDARELASRLREVGDLETFKARELVELRPLLTVSAVRPGEWAGGALVLSRIEPSSGAMTSVLALGVDLPAALRGAVARVEGSGRIEYRRVAACDRSGRKLTLWPQLEGTYEPETARVFVGPRHAVNVNTAPRRVIEALFTGLSFGAAPEQGEIDFVTPKEAAAVAARVVERPLRSYRDLEAVLGEAVAASEISASDAQAILLCAIDPGHPQLHGATAPICFRSGGTFTVVSTGIVNDKAGNELARRSYREVVAVSPPREATLVFDSQADFYYEAGKFATVPGRRGNLVETHPVPIRARTDEQAIRFPDRSHEPGTGEIRSKTAELAEWKESDTYVNHYREELDGHELAAGKPEVLSGVLPVWTDPAAGGEALSVAGVSIEPADWPKEVLAPGLVEMWFKPDAAQGRQMIFDGGQGDFTDRVALWFENGELVFRVAGAALPTKAGDPWLDAAELRALFRPEKDTWYHVCAAWKGTKAGDLALFLDGISVGEMKAHARLAAPASVSATALVLDRPLPRGTPADGALQVGTEVVEYTGYAGGTGVRIVEPGGRGARGSRARAHAPATPVEIWGYENLFYPQVTMPEAVAALLAQLQQPNPLETTRPDGSLWRGGGKLAQKLPKRTPIAMLKAGAGATIGPDEKRLPVILCPPDSASVTPASLSAAGFPPRGFILIEHELAYYGRLGPDSFEDVVRYVAGRPPLVPVNIGTEEFAPPGIPMAQRIPYHYYGYELIEPASIELDDASDYPDSWWIEIDDEWFRYYKAAAIDWAALNPASGFDPALARNMLLVVPPPGEIISGSSYVRPGEPARIYGGTARDSWRSYEEYLARMNLGAQLATGAPVPPWAYVGSPPDQHFHTAMDWGRALAGTAPADHAPGALARIPYALTRPYCGRGDLATLLDAAPAAPKRIPVRVRRAAWSSDLLAAIPIAGALGVRLFAQLATIEDLLPLERRFAPAQGARLVKHPSGGLALEAPQELSIGARRQGGEIPSEEPGAPFAGRIDEVRVAKDDLSQYVIAFLEPAIAGARGLEPHESLPEYALRGQMKAGLHRAERGLRPFWDPAGQQPKAIGAGDRALPWWSFFGQYADTVNRAGALFLCDEEVIGLVRASSAEAEMKRGLMARRPAAHSDEAVCYLLPFPAMARIEGLAGEKGERIAATGGFGQFRERGYIAIDAGNGEGISELMPFESHYAEGFVRPLDDRLRGAFRGSFGTGRAPLVEGDLVYDFPFRFFDRYAPGIESGDAVFWEAAWSPPGAGAGEACLFRSIEWDEKELPNKDVVVNVLARVDGAPAWDEQPTNRPGGLFLFYDPKMPNEIGVAGREIEVRVVLTYKVGAFQRGTWKETARVDAVRVKYVAPVAVLDAEEVE